MKHTHYGHSTNKDAASYHILTYLADYVLEYRQGTDMHGVCDIPGKVGDEKDVQIRHYRAFGNNTCHVRCRMNGAKTLRIMGICNTRR